MFAVLAVHTLCAVSATQYFGNEMHEAKRYDAALAQYEQAALKTTTSLALLNFGQQVRLALSALPSAARPHRRWGGCVWGGGVSCFVPAYPLHTFSHRMLARAHSADLGTL